MRISRGSKYTTIKTEGGLLPADLLSRIAEGDSAIDGLSPEAFHLAKSERLNEAANRAWNRLQGAWEGFKNASESLPDADIATTTSPPQELDKKPYVRLRLDARREETLLFRRAFIIA